jgi:hypothetical protein
MKNRISLLGIIAIVAIIGLGFTACDDTTVAVTGVTVAPATLALTVGGSTGTLTPTIAPENATNQAVTWSTSNAAVAAVNNGTVTAVSAGTAEITVTTTDGRKTATCVVTVTPFVSEYAIGETGPGGGKIIYVSASGFNVAGLGTCHYLEAAPTNQATNVRWSRRNAYHGVSGKEIGTGKANTASIIAFYSRDTSFDNAAKAAVTCTSGGKSDWFLPSIKELIKMYEARTHLGISSGQFWSSSHGGTDTAWYQNFSSGGGSFLWDKGGNNGEPPFRVRAVRAF